MIYGHVVPVARGRLSRTPVRDRLREPDFCSTQQVFDGVRDTAAHGGKSAGLLIAFIGANTRFGGAWSRPGETVSVDKVGGKQTFGNRAW